MELASHTIEEHLGIIVVDGQRCEVWVRSEPDADGIGTTRCCSIVQEHVRRRVTSC